MIKRAQSVDTTTCPVSDDVLGHLYRSPEERIVQTVSMLPPVQRARLAVFCYGRAHLNEMALAIASTCEREILIDIAHRVGEALYLQSRERGKPAERPAPGKRNITLASSALPDGSARRFLLEEPLDEEVTLDAGELDENCTTAPDASGEDERAEPLHAVAAGF